MQDIFFKSTSKIISLLQKIIDARFTHSGLENIPDAPCLFVANHFTRFETFILPYILHKYSNKQVRSLADDQVFVGTLGAYLKKMGTISTRDPKRNKIILQDLVVGEKDWLIYPEGVMMKNKDITISNKIILNLGDKKKDMHTGAAVLALQAELIKRDYLKFDHHGQRNEIKNLFAKYDLIDEVKINPKPLYIVPITISFYPIRTGSNKLLKLAQKFLKEMPARFLEELEIEGNLIFDAEIDIKFNEPINLFETLKMQKKFLSKLPLLSHFKRNELLVNFNRHRLINRAMKDIYSGLKLNFDHIFVLIIANYSASEIKREEFKQLFMLVLYELRKAKKYNLHNALADNVYNLFLSDGFEYLASFEELAVKQNIIEIKNDKYLLKKDNLNKQYDFHEIRQKNTCKVLLNETKTLSLSVKHFPFFAEDFKSSDLSEYFFNNIIKEDLREYFFDYEEYFNKDEAKPRNQGEPYYLAGKEGYPGIIISHGYKSSPTEVNEISKFLNNLGYHIYAVRLKGHGTTPINLKYTKWQDWFNSYLKGYVILSQKCDKIFAAGFSTGGLLALLLAAKNLTKLQAVISINAAVKINDIKVNFVPGVHFWNELLDNFNASKGKKEYIIDTPENPHINHAKNYLKGVYELKKLMGESAKNLANISIPTLIIQGDKDPVVNPKSAKIIYNKISSETKKIYTPKRDNHVIILGKGKDTIFNQVKLFLEKL